MASKLIDLTQIGQTEFQKRALRVLARPISNVLSIDEINEIYAEVVANPQSQTNIFSAILSSLRLTVNVAPIDLIRVPVEGPAIVVSNHPFGGADGIVLASVMSARRPDVKILGNSILANIPEMRPWLLSVDPYDARQGKQRNLGPLLNAVRHVKEGGMLLVFPGRQISDFRPETFSITDQPWSRTIGRLIRLTKATVVPVFFSGQNSTSFQFLAKVHPIFRTVLAPRELVRRRSTTIDIRIGERIPFGKLKDIETNENLINLVRCRSYIMANREELRLSIMPADQTTRELPILQEEIIPQVSQHAMRLEIESLPQQQKLVETPAFSVFYANANQVPHILLEIGRLREITFREVGEGTGKSVDLDAFYDAHYMHLFVWSKSEGNVVGAYRLGLAPEILEVHGPTGLYTNLLFKYDAKIWQSWGNCIELGRAFVRAEFQKQRTPLFLLWKGICNFVLLHPKYRTLFGPLSISKSYSPVSKTIIESYVRKHLFDAKLSKFARARFPFKNSTIEGVSSQLLQASIRGLDDVSSLVSSIEPDGKGIPVLFRQYSRFDFRVLAFNVNPYFSSSVDGLMFVDLLKVNPKEMSFYMGDDSYRGYLDYHQNNQV